MITTTKLNHTSLNSGEYLAFYSFSSIANGIIYKLNMKLLINGS